MPSTSPWHHSPPHRFEAAGVYFITGATFQKTRFFNSPDGLDILQNLFFEVSEENGHSLHAWAFMGNHYHAILECPEHPEQLPGMLRKFHMLSAKAVNALARQPGRRVWFQYWDTQITYPNSYWPRVRYVHENPVKHGLVTDARDYRWCSAAWFAEKASQKMQKKLRSYKCDKVSVYDDF